MFVTRRSRFTTVGPALLFAACMAGSGRSNQADFTTIDVPGGSGTQAFGINAIGEIVGEHFTATGFPWLSAEKRRVHHR